MKGSTYQVIKTCNANVDIFLDDFYHMSTTDMFHSTYYQKIYFEDFLSTSANNAKQSSNKSRFYETFFVFIRLSRKHTRRAPR